MESYLHIGERKLEFKKTQWLTHGHTANETSELGSKARPIIFHLKYLASKPRTDAENSVSKVIYLHHVGSTETGRAQETSHVARHEKIENCG